MKNLEEIKNEFERRGFRVEVVKEFKSGKDVLIVYSKVSDEVVYGYNEDGFYVGYGDVKGLVYDSVVRGIEMLDYFSCWCEEEEFLELLYDNVKENKNDEEIYKNIKNELNEIKKIIEIN